MSSPRRRAAPPPRPTPDMKVAKSYRLAPARIAAARRALGARTDTEAIETALDLVVLRRELLRGTAAMAGTDLAFFDSLPEA